VHARDRPERLALLPRGKADLGAEGYRIDCEELTAGLGDKGGDVVDRNGTIEARPDLLPEGVTREHDTDQARVQPGHTSVGATKDRRGSIAALPTCHQQAIGGGVIGEDVREAQPFDEIESAIGDRT